MYKVVKLVKRENDKRLNKAFDSLDSNTEELTIKTLNLISQSEIHRRFAQKRVFFRKVGNVRATTTILSAYDRGYLSHPGFDKELKPEDRYISVPEKGILLLDGIPFVFRIGLLKAYYEEYGGVVTALTTGAIGAVLLVAAKGIESIIRGRL